MLFQIFKKILRTMKTLYFKVSYQFSNGIRIRFWDNRAPDVHEQYGSLKNDYYLLEKILNEIRPRNLLDIGCGTGRLFQLYNKMGIAQVIGQDISSVALEIATKRHNYRQIITINKPILELNYTFNYFDLIVSNRVLQHIPCKQIECIISKITFLGKFIYINELTDSDGLEEISFMFKHNYEPLFKKYGFELLRSNLLDRQTWYLFGRG